MRALGLPAGPLVVALAVAVSFSGCAATLQGSPAGDRAVSPVVLWANCTANGVEARATPWEVSVPVNRDLEWQVDPSSPIDNVRIVQINNWPFNGGPPAVSKGNPGKGQGVKNGVSVGDRFHYGIQFTCPDGRVMIVDPDIIIVNGT
jgi:hypothetical protein